jgi:carbonic anhydrase
MTIDRLIDGYRSFRSKYDSEHEVFLRLAEEGQDPKVMWIGCADSRVVPELITGADPGELFDVRNIANVVPPSTSTACATGAAVEYAVRHLRVEHIVVCGHTDCGGIAALESDLDAAEDSHIVAWIEHARPAREAVLAAGVPDDARSRATVETNVLIQLDNLRTYGCVADAVRAGRLKLHGWLYDLAEGRIRAHDPATGDWQLIARRAAG